MATGHKLDNFNLMAGHSPGIRITHAKSLVMFLTKQEGLYEKLMNGEEIELFYNRASIREWAAKSRTWYDFEGEPLKNVGKTWIPMFFHFTGSGKYPGATIYPPKSNDKPNQETTDDKH